MIEGGSRNMRKLLIFGLIFLICLPSIYARRKRPTSGTVDNNVYTDDKYDFKLTILDNWDPEVQKPDDRVRLVLVQKDHKIPPELMPYPQLAEVPRVEIYVSEVPFSPPAFVDSIMRDTYKSDVKSEIMHRLYALEENVTFDGLKKSRQEPIEIDGKDAIRWEGTAHFTVRQGTHDFTRRSYAVGLFAVKNGDLMMTFTLTCEGMFFPEILEEVKKMVHSLKWPAE
jgi:hypothetical protein